MVLCCRLGARIHSGAVSVVADSGGVFFGEKWLFNDGIVGARGLPGCRVYE